MPVSSKPDSAISNSSGSLTFALFLPAQMYQITSQFLSKEWIMEKWDAGFYITAVAGAFSQDQLRK